MNASKYFATLLAASLVGACASVPEQSAGNGAVSTADGVRTAEVATSRVVDLNNMQAADSAGTVTCRDMLKQGSNVIVTRCMTEADWQRFKRQEAIEAQQIVRMLQGSAFR